jgi:hypothetical protein
MPREVDRVAAGGPINKKHDGAGGADDASASKIRDREDIAAQLRRRRAASLRMPPLACGRRDPLDLPGRRG